MSDVAGFMSIGKETDVSDCVFADEDIEVSMGHPPVVVFGRHPLATV
ncbi:MAG TPA: hypothetical protein VLS51_12330 [Propionibacteriaceae bacterium]|nr:hypothetical protein [Propionibacteriaceae bacterium]